MIVSLIIYAILELVNVVYVGLFGFMHPMDQPIVYRTVRVFLRLGKFAFAWITAFFLLRQNMSFESLLIFASPILVEKVLYMYCRRREIKRLVRLYTKPSGNFKPMSLAVAKDTAKTVTDMHKKDYFF